MSHIASAHNPKLKALRRLHAKRERARTESFLAEGEDLVLAAARAGVAPIEGYRLAGVELPREIDAGGFHEVDREALASASALGSSSRVIGVYRQRWGAPAGPLCVYLHGVADPGNVGAVLRSAHAFGASSVTLGPHCADPHSPKAVRASMGAVFTVPLAHAGGPDELPGTRVALTADADTTLRELAGALEPPVTLLVGSERQGLPAEVLAACDSAARIPIVGDSLNAAMAASVALYELTRSHELPRTRVRAS